jgi:DNA helicase HerA-like ATPase
VFFCTQQPTDLPDDVLAQLGTRIQHALRAFTPDDQKALARTVRTYPTTPHYELERALTSLGTGEAIVTVLSERGAPTPVAWTRLRAPRSLMDTIGPDSIRRAASSSGLAGRYGQTVDCESSYELLRQRLAAGPDAPASPPDRPPPGERDREHEPDRERDQPSMAEKVLGNPAVRSFVRSAASALGREITRGIFGTRRRRR